MSQRSKSKHDGFNRPAAALIVSQAWIAFCLTSAAWGQSSPNPAADRPTIAMIDPLERGRVDPRSTGEATVFSDANQDVLWRPTGEAKPYHIGDPNEDILPATSEGRGLCLSASSKRTPGSEPTPRAATLVGGELIADACALLERDAYEQAGRVWADKGRHDLAIALFSEAISLDPADAAAYYYRGNSWFLLAAYVKAVDDYTAEIRIAGGHAHSYYQRGLAYEKLGELGKALIDFERRLDEAPADPDADSAVARVLAAVTATWSIAGVDDAHPIRLLSEAGAFVVPVVINGEITLKFVVDSGAADVSIPADVVSTLMRTGSLKPTDITGEHEYQLADGSRMLSKTFTIRSLRVGDVVVENVRATISPSQGALLLGQTFLGRFSSWSIDNANELLVLK